MSFEYNSEIVTTSTGEVDVQYYRQEAGRLRSEELSLVIKSMVKSVKKTLNVPADLYHAVSNLAFSGKMAK